MKSYCAQDKLLLYKSMDRVRLFRYSRSLIFLMYSCALIFLMYQVLFFGRQLYLFYFTFTNLPSTFVCIFMQMYFYGNTVVCAELFKRVCSYVVIYLWTFVNGWKELGTIKISSNQIRHQSFVSKLGQNRSINQEQSRVNEVNQSLSLF